MNLLFIDNIKIGTASLGCTAAILKTDYVEVVDCTVNPPTAVINANQISGCTPLNINYTDGSLALPDSATSWLWNFGDATFSTSQHPGSHVYNTTGTYFVSMEACNDGGCTTDYLTVTALGPSAYGSFTDTICANSMYTLPSGTDVFGPGVYSDTIAGFLCDSIITATLVSPTGATYQGLYGASFTDYYQVNPLTGVFTDTFTANPSSLGWTNASFTVHQQSAVLYWISEQLELNSLNLVTGIQSSMASDIGTLPFFWGLRYYDGYLYTLTRAVDNDKMLVRIDPSTGNLDGGFTGIEINATASYELSFGSSR